MDKCHRYILGLPFDQPFFLCFYLHFQRLSLVDDLALMYLDQVLRQCQITEAVKIQKFKIITILIRASDESNFNNFLFYLVYFVRVCVKH